MGYGSTFEGRLPGVTGISADSQRRTQAEWGRGRLTVMTNRENGGGKALRGESRDLFNMEENLPGGISGWKRGWAGRCAGLTRTHVS